MSETSRSERRPRIILDCDPGHDDAIAIVVGRPPLRPRRDHHRRRQRPLDRTTHNARVMRELLGIDVPVHAGAARPLLAEPITAADVHGASGLDGADLPADAARPTRTTPLASSSSRVAAAGHVDRRRRAADERRPGVARRARSRRSIAGISVMGGGTFGSRTAVGEFNMWADPEAAAIVFGYGGRW